MKVTWIGHACCLLEIDGVRLLTDPVLTGSVGPLTNMAGVGGAGVPTVDAVLVSHVHRDHLHVPSLRMLAPGTRVVVPRGAAHYLRLSAHLVTEEIEVGETVTVGTVTVTATPADHLAIRNRRGRAVPAVGYLVRGSGTAYFAGDTDVFPGMAELGGADLALLPVGGWGLTLGPGHMDPTRAVDALGLLSPRMALPIHWGTLRLPIAWRTRPDLFLEPGPSFAQLAKDRAPATRVVVAEPGEGVDVPLSTTPGG